MRDIHHWFELTYAEYLTVPRSILEAMPEAWQAQMAALLGEMDATFDWQPHEGRYWVTLKDGGGRFVQDPLRQYRHADTTYIESLRKAIKFQSSAAITGGCND